MNNPVEHGNNLLFVQTVQAVIWNQLLFTAGYSLTTGGFLTYFAKDLNASKIQIAIILIIPETLGTFGLLSRHVINYFQSRKKTWLYLSILSRIMSFGIPLAAIVHMNGFDHSLYYLFIPAMIITAILNSFAYMAYLSWLSDLAPEQKWGEFFAKRNIAKLFVLLIVPVAAGYTRDWLRKDVSAETAIWIYIGIFCFGLLLLFASLIPMLVLKDVIQDIPSRPVKRNYKYHLQQVIQNRSLKFLLLHNWWLAFFNGLTQSVFFLYLFSILKIKLGMFYVLLSTMQLIKIPISKLAGKWCDENREKSVMLISLFIASSGLIFWILATKETWYYLFGAYACWGAYAGLNLSGRNLLLKISPRSDNSFELSLFRQVGGFFAGVSGLLGGYWLTQLEATHFSYTISGYEIGPFHFLFIFSLTGRYLSSLWLILIKLPDHKFENPV